MDLLESLDTLKRHGWMILLLCLSATVVTTAVTYLMTEKYEAKALMLVRPTENIKLTGSRDDKELVGFPVGGGGISKVEVPSNTYVQIIKSRMITEKVVRFLHLDADQEPPATTAIGRLVALVRRQLREWNEVMTQLFSFGRVLGPVSPFERAVERVEKNISLTVIRDAFQFEIKYEGPKPQEAAAVANAVADLFVEYLVAVNSADMKKALDFLEDRLRTSEKELQVTREALRQFKQGNQTISFKEETAEEIKVIAGLESDLEKTNVRLAGLLNGLTPANPKVEMVQAEKDRLVAAIRGRQQRINQLPDKERQLVTLNLSVQVADEVYQLIRKEYEEARVRGAKSISEIRIVSAAVPSFYPSKPIKYKYAGSALGIALLVGIGLALLLDYVNTTVRSIKDVERELKLRVLATIPQVGPARRP